MKNIQYSYPGFGLQTKIHTYNTERSIGTYCTHIPPSFLLTEASFTFAYLLNIEETASNYSITYLSKSSNQTTQTIKRQQQKEENEKSSERKEFILSWCTSRNCPFGWWNHGKMFPSLLTWIAFSVIPISIRLNIFFLNLTLYHSALCKPWTKTTTID